MWLQVDKGCHTILRENHDIYTVWMKCAHAKRNTWCAFSGLMCNTGASQVSIFWFVPAPMFVLTSIHTFIYIYIYIHNVQCTCLCVPWCSLGGCRYETSGKMVGTIATVDFCSMNKFRKTFRIMRKGCRGWCSSKSWPMVFWIDGIGGCVW